MRETLTGTVVAALLAVAAAAAAQAAQTSVNDLLKAYDSGELDREYVTSILAENESGLGWANMRLHARDVPPIYCAPDNVKVSGEQLLDMIRHEVKENDRFGQTPYGLAVMRVMENRFPCISSGRQE